MKRKTKSLCDIHIEAEEKHSDYIRLLEESYEKLYLENNAKENLNEDLRHQIDYLKEIIGQLITKEYKEEKESEETHS